MLLLITFEQNTFFCCDLLRKCTCILGVFIARVLIFNCVKNHYYGDLCTDVRTLLVQFIAKLYLYYSGVLKCYSQFRDCRPWCSRLSKLTEAPCTPGCGGVTYQKVAKNDSKFYEGLPEGPWR